MKKVLAFMLCTMLVLGGTAMTTYATSLDDVVNANNQQNTNNTQTNDSNTSDSTSKDKGYVSAESFANSLKDATDLSQTSEVATKVNGTLNKVVTIIVQILAYAVTILLTLRVVLDLAFITLPFTRTFLGNGYMGNAQAGMDDPMGMQGSMGMGSPMGGGMMGGMGSPMGGFGGGMGGMGGMGSMGGGMMGGGMYGRRGYGGMGGGYGNRNMGAMQQAGMQQANQQPAMSGRIQWVSNAALNAVAAENIPDGKAGTPLRIYAKDMVVLLVATPLLLILAITGALTNVGFMLGDIIAQALSNLGGMF